MSEKLTDASPEVAPTLAQMQMLLQRQREDFLAQGPPSLAQRLSQLERLQDSIGRHQEQLVAAISADFGNRSRNETVLSELAGVIAGIEHARKCLPQWMRRRRVSVPESLGPADAWIEYQPLGTVGIIAPWNYPFQMAVLPLVPALAAGNRVMIKPSEITPRTAALMQAMIGDLFAPEEVALIPGDVAVARQFSCLPFDHIFFTGSTAVGREVAQAAARNLVPVTLELGGKTPTIIDEGYSLEAAADRIAFGKMLNSGQVCISPDYCLVPRSARDEFVSLLAERVRSMYPGLTDNPDYTHIISEGHASRVRDLISDAREKGAQVISLGSADDHRGGGRRVPPALVIEPTSQMRIIEEEIFGPVLAVHSYDTLDDAIRFINVRPRPLAVYVFSNDEQRTELILRRTTSGGVTINDTLFHAAVQDLPFGGVGASGMGRFHGSSGFETFSNAKSVFQRTKARAPDARES